MITLSQRRKIGLCLLLSICLSACAAYSYHEFNQRFGDPTPKGRIVASRPETEFFNQQVAPIINSRCVVCHACYDAPCQLKLSSSEGIDRGITETPVYSGKRLIAADPTRLFVDESSTRAWRARDFHPVLNERQDAPEANLAGSLIARVLDLKQEHPLPGDKVLSTDHFNFALNRENQCPTIETFSFYSLANPLAGMPYGLPGLQSKEIAPIKQWLLDGAWLPAASPLAKPVAQAVQSWEQWLNGGDNKTRLFARYFYEHLFLANLFFDELQPLPEQRTYFKVVRSKTPPGKPIEVIATRRPSDDPGSAQFYYRLQHQPAQIVSKTHLPYALNNKRRQWLEELFFAPDYTVATLPGYGKEEFNPFITFSSIPAKSRYRFLLEESHFYIAGFIKGPVCRGQVAVDVINDQFWVYFVNPDAYASPMLNGFLEQQAGNLRLPGEQGSNGKLLAYWTTYSELHRNYLLAKSELLNEIFAKHPIDTALIWDGDGDNQNAALSVFRNFDDAAVRKGLLGKPPKTAWVIDYPLLERIHYLLTVDFDVYGNIAHQLNTRLYMDFLRIEGEFNFLTLLPKASRVELRDYWYRNSSDRLNKQLKSYKVESLPEPAIEYTSNDPQKELYQLLSTHLKQAVAHDYELSHKNLSLGIVAELEKLQSVHGKAAALLSETSVLLITDNDQQQHLVTLLANRAHLNITSLFGEKDNRIPEEDTITVTHGLVGDYPNIFFHLQSDDLSKFVQQLAAMTSEEDYSALLDNYGIRRTQPEFWPVSDAIHTQYRKQQPDIAGWLDYNRYDNR